MRVFRKIMALTLALTLTLSMGAIAWAETKASNPTLTLSTTDLKLGMGETATITVTTPGVSSVEWGFDKFAPYILDIQESDDGLELTVTGESYGKTVYLTARSEGYADAVCKVLVRSEAALNPDHKISILQSRVLCEVGSTPTIDITAVGVSSVNWESDDPSIASVEAVGNGYSQAKVTALKAGKTTITAENDDGSIYDTCRIEIVEVGGMYSKPGTWMKFNETNFTKKASGEELSGLDWRFSTEYLEITSQKILKGANLVKKLIINDDDYTLNLYLNQDYNLVCPDEPNLVFDKIELTAKKDYSGVMTKGDVFVLNTGLLDHKVGYPQLNVSLDDTVEYVDEIMTNFVAANGVTSGTASISIGDVYIEGEVRAGDKVLIAADYDVDKNLLGQFPDAEIRFCNIHTNGFPRANDLQLLAEEDEFVYKVKNGKLVRSGLVWSDKDYAWVGKITNSTSYLISDKTLGDVPEDKPDNKPSGGGTGSSNTANTPETIEKVKDTVDALKNPEKKLPADVAKTTTAGGKEISTIPVALTTGAATVGMDLFNTLGGTSSNVGLKFTVKAGLAGGSMEIIVPGGFGKITEPGRISYSMDYADKAENNDTMLKAVKGENVTSTTAKIGGNHTLPVTATITVATKLANGTAVNIYKYDPITRKFTVVGKAVAKDGKLTFGTKVMGQMLFTTGTI